MRRGKLGVCTRRMNEVKALLAEGCDVESIKQENNATKCASPV